jgi:hypothetical protein
MRAGPIVDVLQKSDESLALIGFAVAPADQRERNQNADDAARDAIENGQDAPP